MKGSIIFKTAKAYVGKATRTVRMNSPTILIVAGSAGVIAGVVLAIKAGKESDAKTAQEKEELEYIKSHKKIADKTLIEEYEDGTVVEHTLTTSEYKKELAGGYARLIFAYIKVYGPAVLTTLFSLFLILKSHSILYGRYTTMCAGFAAMSKAYDAYRQNVIDAEGIEADERYRLGIKTIEEEKMLLDKTGNPKLDKNGNPKKFIERYDILDGDPEDPRTVLWDEVTTAKSGKYDNYSTDEDERVLHNTSVIRAAQESANNIMKHRANNVPTNNGIGYMFLNEVRQMLGVEPIDIGNLVGWRYDPRLDVTSDKYDAGYDLYCKEHKLWGDNKVDFGLDNPKVPGYDLRLKFLTGHEDAILLYMNYDGEIWNKVGKPAKFPLKKGVLNEI